jgi:hypothetical protein
VIRSLAAPYGINVTVSSTGRFTIPSRRSTRAGLAGGAAALSSTITHCGNRLAFTFNATGGALLLNGWCVTGASSTANKPPAFDPLSRSP